MVKLWLFVVFVSMQVSRVVIRHASYKERAGKKPSLDGHGGG